MANIVLPQVNILSEVNDSTNVLVEQDGVIQRVAINNFNTSKEDENDNSNANGVLYIEQELTDEQKKNSKK